MGSSGRHLLINGALAADAGSSLRFGRRGPLLVEDRLLHQTILAFAHGSVRPRVVHANGVVAHGWFECTEPLDDVCAVHAFAVASRRTKAVVRFSTMSSGLAARDSVRDVRGMAVRLLTADGDLDLLCQSIPVSFVQDALLYPRVVAARRALTPTPFWRLVSSNAEMVHAVLHVMSSAGVPAGYDAMDAHAVHTFRLVGANGRWQYAKLHWLVVGGTEAFDTDEARQVGVDDPAALTRRLAAAVRTSQPPAWDLAVQVFDEDAAARQPYDVLDPTKLLPVEEAPMRIVGRLVLDTVGPADTDRRSTGRGPLAPDATPLLDGADLLDGTDLLDGAGLPDHPEALDDRELAFAVAHLVPGIDISEDPVLQARMAAYLPAHLARLGAEALWRRQTDAAARPLVGPQIIGVADHVERVRTRPPLFGDHHGQARQFWLAQPGAERAHIVDAVAHDLQRCPRDVVHGALDQLGRVDTALALAVGRRVGMDTAMSRGRLEPADDMPAVPSMSVRARRRETIAAHGAKPC